MEPQGNLQTSRLKILTSRARKHNEGQRNDFSFYSFCSYRIDTFRPTAAASTSERIEEVISGGLSQSEDPSRYDYIPPTIDPNSEMTPQSAIGSQMIASFSFNFLGQTIQVPAALLTHEIRGSGTWVDYAGAFYATPTQVCNYRIDYQNRGTDGRIFNTWKGSNVWDCTFGVVNGASLYSLNLYPGSQCARLFVNGVFRGEQCHSIN